MGKIEEMPKVLQGLEEGGNLSVWKQLGIRKGFMEELAFKVTPSKDHY